MELKQAILKHALENAVKFKGRANPGAVVGKILSEFSDAKQNMKEISKQINDIIKEVNAMGLEEQEKKLLELNPNHFNQQKEQKKQHIKKVIVY